MGGGGDINESGLYNLIYISIPCSHAVINSSKQGRETE